MSTPADVVPALERATHRINVYLSRELAPLGLTQAEAHVLGRLAAGASSPNELHHLFGHKRSTLTSVLDRLEGRGYTEREIHPDDRRSSLISLTKDGKAAAASVARAVLRLERRVAEATSSRDRTGFAAVLAALEAAVAGDPGT